MAGFKAQKEISFKIATFVSWQRKRKRRRACINPPLIMTDLDKGYIPVLIQIVPWMTVASTFPCNVFYMEFDEYDIFCCPGLN